MAKVLFERLTGWSKNFLLQSSIYLYSPEVIEPGELAFLTKLDGGDECFLEFLLDLKGENGVLHTVAYYPYTDEKLVCTSDPEARIRMGEVLSLVYTELYEKYKGERDTFTYDALSQKEISYSDFSSSSPDFKNKYCLFIKKSRTGTKSTFPQFFVMEIKDTTDYRTFLPLFPLLSRAIAAPTGSPTETGMYFSFLLAKSYIKGELVTKAPYLKSVKFPTSDSNLITSFYKMDVLDELVRSKEIGKIIRTSSGYKLENSTIVTPDVADMNSIGNRIAQDMVDKNEINLTDVLQFGVPETAAMISCAEKPVKVHVNVGDYAASMCFLNGMFHAIPLKDPGSKENLMMEFDRFLNVCTVDNFPG